MATAPYTNLSWAKPNCNIVLAEKWRSLGYKGWNSRKTSLYHFGEACAAKFPTDSKPFNVPALTRTTFITAFSNDSSLIASCHGDHRIHIFNAKTLQLVKSLEGHERSPWCVTFHCSTNDLLASGSLNGEVRVWDINGGACETLYLHSDDDVCRLSQYPVTSLSFHPYGRLLAIAIFNEIHFWDWNDAKPFIVIKTKAQEERVRLVRFDSLGQFILTGVCNHDDSSDEDDEDIYQNHGFHCNCRLCFSNRSRMSDRTTDPPSRRFANLRWSNRRASRTPRTNAALLSDLFTRSQRLRRYAVTGMNAIEDLRQSELFRLRRRHVESSSSDSEPEASEINSAPVDAEAQVDARADNMTDNIFDTLQTLRSPRLRSPLNLYHENILNAQVSVNEEIQHQYNRLQFLRNERRRLQMRLQDLQNQQQVTNRATVSIEPTNEIDARSILHPLTDRAETSSAPRLPSPLNPDPMWPSSSMQEPPTRTSRNHGFATDVLRRRFTDSLSNIQQDSFFPDTSDMLSIPLHNVDMQVETTERGLSLPAMTTVSADNQVPVVISPPEAAPPMASPIIRARNRQTIYRSRSMRGPRRMPSAFASFHRSSLSVGSGGVTSYRLQWWSFDKCELPKLDRADLNVVLANCRIYNDSSVDISHDRSFLAAFVDEILDESMFVGIFSLEKHNFGDLLYKKKYGSDAVCLNISPLDRYIAVGVKSRHFCTRFISREKNVVSQILKLGKTDNGEMAMVGQIVHPRNTLSRRLVSINTVTWMPDVGHGIIYGTNTGELRACYPGNSQENEVDASLVQ